MNVHPWGLITSAGVVACLATVMGCAGRLLWFFDLFSHFRVQYLFGLSILGIILFIAGRRKSAIVFIVFAGINFAVILPLYLGGQPEAPQGLKVTRAMLLNVNTHSGNPKKIEYVIQQLNPDIVVLEEISSQWVRDLEWLMASHPYVCIQPREDNFGIGLFSKLPLIKNEVVYIGRSDVPSIIATINIQGSELDILATHPLPPNGAEYSKCRNEQLESISDYIDPSSSLLLLGDLNVTPWSHHFKTLLKRSGLIDSNRGCGVQPSWPAGNPLLWIPIDHCLHSPDILVIQRRIGPDVGSDHYPVIIDFVITTNKGKLSGISL